MNVYKHLLNSNRLTVTNDPHFSIVFAIEMSTPHTPSNELKKKKTYTKPYNAYATHSSMYMSAMTNRIKIKKVQVVLGTLIRFASDFLSGFEHFSFNFYCVDIFTFYFNLVCSFCSK